jgi:medium-chain acyl-[acyl-carrier-protein] hydrolase
MAKTLLLKEHIVTSAETDLNGQMRPGALLNVCIQAAIDSADQLGFGFKNLAPQGLFWVLSRFSIEIERPVQWQEKIIIETWPKGMDRLFYLRDFLLKDQKNKPVANATSAWLAVQASSKRPALIQTEDESTIFALKDQHALPYSPIVIDTFIGWESDRRSPRYFDFDLNGHVTATRYLDWMMDTFPIDFFKENFLQSIHINFLKETLPGQELIIFKKEIAQKKYQLEGKHTADNKTAFRGILKFT